MDKLKNIFSRFNTKGSWSGYERYGSGHIHDTYLIKTTETEFDDYIIQRINNKVFTDVPGLQENIERVTIHLKKKIESIPDSDPGREVLTVVYAHDGKTWINDDEGNFWRMFLFIPRHRSYNIVDSPDKAFEGGKAIGRFQAMLADLPGKQLNETIPYFHDIEKRLETFHTICGIDYYGRASAVETEIKFVLARSEKMKTILRLGREGVIPLRITHNDTKFNNILLDENDRALCMIDLDTVMPGYVHYDFGDAIRTGASSAAEDETDLSKVKIDLNLFSSFSKGYLSETKNTLNQAEIDQLAFAPILITYTIAVRFLTDYLDGDKYFRIHHPDHNLQRTRAQMKLVENMEENFDNMKSIISEILEKDI